MSMAVRSLDAVWRDASPFPTDLLAGSETGLCLFAAAFYGANDAIHMDRAGMKVDLVDISDRVLEMGDMYGVRPHQGDAWAYAKAARISGARWDVVSVDTFTRGDTERSIATIGLWCSIARRAVVMTIEPSRSAPVTPDGWRATRMRRSPLADWLILTREASV